jgi:uncharacterized protein YjbI with pentapeptide repeats
MTGQPSPRQSLAVAFLGGALASFVALQTGAHVPASAGLGALFAVGVYVFARDEKKSWGDFGQGISISVIVAIALLAVQHDSQQSIRDLDAHRATQLRHADLIRARTEGRRTEQLTLSLQDNLDYINLSGHDLRGFALINKSLREANLRHARLDDATLSRSRLPFLHADGATFDRAVLIGADLRYALFSEDLIPGDITRRDVRKLRRVSLRWADLQESSLNNAVFLGARLNNAILDKVSGLVDFRAADLRHASLEEANLAHSEFRLADLRHADLSAADLRQARMQYADFREAHLNDVDLCGASLGGAHFEGARYTAHTRFPRGFDQMSHGLIRVREGSTGVETTFPPPPC